MSRQKGAKGILDQTMIAERLEAIQDRLDQLDKLEDINKNLKEMEKNQKEMEKNQKAMEKNQREMEKKMDKLIHENEMLKERNIKKDEEIKALNSRVEELDQLTKLNNVIITGLQIKPRTYAKAAANVNNEDTKSVQNQVTEYLQAKGITLNPENVESCFLLPSKGIEKKRAVVLKFTSKKFKIDLMQQTRKNGQLFEDKVFINEHLTKQNANLAWQARQLKKAGKIQKTWTNNGKVFILPHGSENTKPVLIKTNEDLKKF